MSDTASAPILLTPIQLASIRTRARDAAERIARGTLDSSSAITDRAALIEHADLLAAELAALRESHGDLQRAADDVTPVLQAAAIWSAYPDDEGAALQLQEAIHHVQHALTPAAPAP